MLWCFFMLEKERGDTRGHDHIEFLLAAHIGEDQQGSPKLTQAPHLS
jgi:hypothetical protein